MDGERAIKAGVVAAKGRLYLIDKIIYSYVDKTYLLTGDKHFKDKGYVELIEWRLCSK